MRNFSLVAPVCLLLSVSVSLQAADVPRPAPAASYKTPTGATINIADYKGKVVALEFLITTCPHCQRCSALLQKMYKEYGPRGFQPLGVATNDMAHMLVPDYVRQFGLSYPVGYAPREKAHEFLQLPLMLIMYVPQLVFIDRQGVIRAQYGGQDKFFTDEETNMRKQIEAMLSDAKPAGGAKKSAPAKKATS
ncbi:MAG: TlpA family protein disulfide reductase [Acidobacteriia bacterium]|nr:TlpA family protein disulfide reductase [Terriglobia bacterium]